MTAFLEPATWRRNPLRFALFAVPAALLLTPAIAMRYTGEVHWTGFDFVFAGVLLFGSAALVDLVMRKTGDWAYRLGAGLAVLTSFLLIWVNGAVGIIGSEDNPANLLFMGVILIAAVGSVVARFAARGMARAMFVAALAQVAIAVATLVAGWGTHEPPGLVGVAALIAFFAALWLLAGGLFANAARARGSSRSAAGRGGG